MKRWWLTLLRYAAPETVGLLAILVLIHVGIGVKLLGRGLSNSSWITCWPTSPCRRMSPG
jgi:hypothetical protein